MRLLNMKLQKRIKRIVSLTVEDYLSHGYIIKESPKSLISSLSDALMQDESIEDAHTYEVSLKVLEMLNSLDIVDLELIHNIVLKEHIQASEVSITFKEMLL
jgi:hypothetical protein